MRRIKPQKQGVAAQAQKPGVAWRGVATPTFIRRGGLRCRASNLRFEPSASHAKRGIDLPQASQPSPEDVIFAKQSLPCESKNHNIAVFAPGNSRRNFSKNCFPVAHLPVDCRFEQIDYSVDITNRSK